MEKPKPKDFGYHKRWGWPDKEKLQKYRHAFAQYQKEVYQESLITKAEQLKPE